MEEGFDGGNGFEGFKEYGNRKSKTTRRTSYETAGEKTHSEDAGEWAWDEKIWITQTDARKESPLTAISRFGSLPAL